MRSGEIHEAQIPRKILREEKVFRERPAPMQGVDGLDHPWPMFRHDPQRTGRSEHAGPTKPKLLWRFKAGSDVPATGPDGTVYFASKDGNIYAIRDGKLLWRFKAGVDVSPLAIGPDGTVYFESRDLNIYAVRNGKLLWRFETGDAVSSLATGPDGTIYFASDGNIYAVRNGKLLWRFRESGRASREEEVLRMLLEGKL